MRTAEKSRRYMAVLDRGRPILEDAHASVRRTCSLHAGDRRLPLDERSASRLPAGGLRLRLGDAALCSRPAGRAPARPGQASPRIASGRVGGAASGFGAPAPSAGGADQGLHQSKRFGRVPLGVALEAADDAALRVDQDGGRQDADLERLHRLLLLVEVDAEIGELLLVVERLDLAPRWPVERERQDGELVLADLLAHGGLQLV